METILRTSQYMEEKNVVVCPNCGIELKMTKPLKIRKGLFLCPACKKRVQLKEKKTKK